MDSRTYKKRVLKPNSKKIEDARKIQSEIKQLAIQYVTEEVKRYRKNGKNLNDSRTQYSIARNAIKRIITKTGYHPLNILHVSTEQLAKELNPDWKEQKPNPYDKWKEESILEKPDTELSQLEKLMKYDPSYWGVTQKKIIHEYKKQHLQRAVSKREYDRFCQENGINSNIGKNDSKLPWELR